MENRGPVIPAEMLEKIFEPMVKLDKASLASGRLGDGLGIGLFIAREIAQGHGGSISADSTTKRGTLFTVLLPRT